MNPSHAHYAGYRFTSLAQHVMVAPASSQLDYLNPVDQALLTRTVRLRVCDPATGKALFKGKTTVQVDPGGASVTIVLAKIADAEVTLDALDGKLAAAFPGRIVRKDLVKKLKVGFNVPVYVLEYLLGKYCSTINEEEIRAGLEQVKSAIAERIVHGEPS